MVEFITTNLAMILCSLLGVGLLILEAFIPGFGLAGITGIVLELISIVLVYLNYGWLAALGATLVVLTVLGIIIFVALRSVSKGRLSKSSVILNDQETVEKGYIASSDLDEFLGKSGIAITALRPAGMAEFGGMKVSVVSDGAFIAQGTPVHVECVKGSRVVVRSAPEEV